MAITRIELVKTVLVYMLELVCCSKDEDGMLFSQCSVVRKSKRIECAYHFIVDFELVTRNFEKSTVRLIKAHNKTTVLSCCTIATCPLPDFLIIRRNEKACFMEMCHI